MIGRNHRQRMEQAVIVLIAYRGNSLMNDIYFPLQYFPIQYYPLQTKGRMSSGTQNSNRRMRNRMYCGVRGR